MKKILVYSWLVLLGVMMAVLFWYTEWKYSLPTPVPANYAAVPEGTFIHLPGVSTSVFNRPVFLHFFNPDCPCSRFNIAHVKKLVQQYSNKVDFKIVLVTSKRYTQKEIQEKFGISLPVLQDTTLATLCGVYSTPQAVIIDNNHKLYYRGNYNRSRYCSDNKTNYAQNALVSLLSKRYQFSFDPMAVKAYGCQLPGCPK